MAFLCVFLCNDYTISANEGKQEQHRVGRVKKWAVRVHMCQPVKKINTNFTRFHSYFGRAHMNFQLYAVPHRLNWATVWEEKLLSSVLSRWGYHCCRVLLSAGFCQLLFLHSSPFLLFFSTPSMNPALPHLCICLAISHSPPFVSVLLCVSFSLSIYTDPVLITITTLQQLFAWVTATIVDSSLVQLFPT